MRQIAMRSRLHLKSGPGLFFRTNAAKKHNTLHRLILLLSSHASDILKDMLLKSKSQSVEKPHVHTDDFNLLQPLFPFLKHLITLFHSTKKSALC